jgi:hypothetical protein
MVLLPGLGTTPIKGQAPEPGTTPLESLLIERILACWVQVHFADALTAHAQQRKAAHSELRYLQKRQESAGRCLTEAVEQLALARRVAQGKSKPVRLAPLTPEQTAQLEALRSQ